MYEVETLHVDPNNSFVIPDFGARDVEAPVAGCGDNGNESISNGKENDNNNVKQNDKDDNDSDSTTKVCSTTVGTTIESASFHLSSDSEDDNCNVNKEDKNCKASTEDDNFNENKVPVFPLRCIDDHDSDRDEGFGTMESGTASISVDAFVAPRAPEEEKQEEKQQEKHEEKQRILAKRKRKRRKHRKNVEFVNIEIREYSITIGDHPWCSYGTPISLDWEYNVLDPIPIDIYEANKKLHKRSKRQMLLNYYQRRDLLWRSGYDIDAIEKQEKKVDRDRRRRAMLAYFEVYFRMEECVILNFESFVKRMHQEKVQLPTGQHNDAEMGPPTTPLQQEVMKREGGRQQQYITWEDMSDQVEDCSIMSTSMASRRVSWKRSASSVASRSEHDGGDDSVCDDVSFSDHFPQEVNDDHLYQASDGSKFDKYSVYVDRSQHDKAVQVVLSNFQRPHMRAFHFSWISFFVAFFTWFSITPLLGEVQDTLQLSKEDIWMSSLCGTAGTIVMRIIMGPACDKFGARICMAFILITSAIPTALTGLIQNSQSLNTVRLFIGIAGSSFVACQYWTSCMFAREVAGTANALVAGWGNLGGGVTQLVVGSALFPLLNYIYSVTIFSSSGTEIDTSERYENEYDNDNINLHHADDRRLLMSVSSSEELAWRTVFIIPALLSFIVALLILRYCDDSPKGSYRELVLHEKITVVSPVESLCSSTHNRNTWILMVQYACCFGVEVTMTNATALYFREKYDQSTVSAAAIASIFGFMNLFARGFGGACSDTCNSKHGIKGRIAYQIVVLVLEGVAIIVFAFADSLVGSIFALIATSIMVQAAEGSTFGIVPYVDRRFTGSVVGYVGAGGNVGGVVFAMFFRQYDYRRAFFLMGLTSSLSSVFCLLFNTKSIESNMSALTRANPKQD